jgi:hypothetical protein
VELARQHAVYSVAHPLRLDYTGLKKRLDGVPDRKKKAEKPAFVELIADHSATMADCVAEFESSVGEQDAHSVEAIDCIRRSEGVFGQGQKAGKIIYAGLYPRVSTLDQQRLPMQSRAMREYASRVRHGPLPCRQKSVLEQHNGNAARNQC